MSHRTKGKARGSSLQPRRKAYFRGRLLESRRRLLERIGVELESPAGTSGRISGDFADIASSSAEQETTFHIGTVETDTVAQIDHALQRIEDGTYGACEDCGRRIPQDRLKVLPFAAVCVECKARREREDGPPDYRLPDWDDVEPYAGMESPDFAETVGNLRGRPPSK